MAETKYNQMIDAFSCDFQLAKDGSFKLARLDDEIKNKNEKLLKDIDLLNELEYRLRHGEVEIVEKVVVVNG